MSRIGKKPIPITDGTEISVKDGVITVKGKLGEQSLEYHSAMTVTYDSDAKEVVVTRPNDSRESRALHGLTRSLINNMIIGVSTYFEKKLEIVGVGYNANLAGDTLNLLVGYANTIKLPVPANVNCELKDPTHITVTSINKQACGQFAANIRQVRPPEPYKGKGIRYQNEHVRRKAGKALAGKG